MAYQYKVRGQVVTLDVDPTVVAVKFQDGKPSSMRAQATEAAGAGPFSKRFEIPGENLTIVPTKAAGPGPAAESAQGAIQSLNAQENVDNAMPVFRVSGNQVVTSDRIIIGLENDADADALIELHKLSLLSSREGVLLAAVAPGEDVFEAIKALDEDPAVRYAEPDFITIGRHIPKRSTPAPNVLANDPLLPKQYAMAITRAVDAWALAAGDPAIKIAILDEGVDTRHPDLAGAVVDAFDTVDNDSFQEPNPWDGHGTACAGLAAAVGENAVGMRGAGAGCSILAVRIAFSQFKGGDWITTNDQIARAINWSWTKGADVLSNSWGGGAPSNAIADEFEFARTKGRNGLGAVVVIAAGNDFGAVSFPGDLPNVLTVAASNEFDEAKTPTSLDGENWWGTNHGPEVDVAAPGVHNLTTDISGNSGYDLGDYTPTFNGTSSATPIVAGACGLILSANPDLTEAEVRAIVKRAADKVGQFPYSGDRNDFFGDGRLNVLGAVKLAIGATPVAANAGDHAAA